MDKLKNQLLNVYERYMFLMGIAGHFVYVFQTHQILVNQSAVDVSLKGFMIAFFSILSWLLYGILKNDKILVSVNAFGMLASTVCLIAIVRFQ